MAVVTYDTGFETNSVAWSSLVEPQRLAVSSYLTDTQNKISILEKNPRSERLEAVGLIPYQYPPTKIGFAPQQAIIGQEQDLLVTASDYLRIWNIQEVPVNSTSNSSIGSSTTGVAASGSPTTTSGENSTTSTSATGNENENETSATTTTSSSSAAAVGAVNPDKKLAGDLRFVFKPTRATGAAPTPFHSVGGGFPCLQPHPALSASGTSGSGSSSHHSTSGAASGSKTHQSGTSGTSSSSTANANNNNNASNIAFEDFCEPVTSFDWNVDKPSMIAATSTDTTISVWDIVTQQLTIQLIAHDKPVYDCSFAPGDNVFTSCGADGSVRVFDLRSMDNCTIVYEEGPSQPMLRVAWSRKSPYIAATVADSPRVVIIDMRNPATPVCVHANHEAPINGIAWAPQYGNTLCCVGEDRRALIWDISVESQAPPTPEMTYEAEAPINGVNWSRAHDDWVSIAFGTKVSLLLV